MFHIYRIFSAAAFAVIGIMTCECLPAMASSLDLSAQPPDLSAGYLNVTYDATTGTLSAVGWPMSFNEGGNPPEHASIVGGNYDLTADLTQSGLPVSGSLKITGTIPGLASSGTLLTGQLQLSQSGFGFQSPQAIQQSGSGDIFEFVFNVTGGDLAPYYQGKASVILDAWCSGFNGSFTTSFAASPYLSVADNSAVVPEPSTAILLLTALALGLPASASRWRHM